MADGNNWLMSLQKELEEMERTDPTVAAAALGFNQMAERLAITPVDNRTGKTFEEDDKLETRFVGLFCDRNCGTEIDGDYMAKTQAKAFKSLRRDAAAQGWAILANQDLCPDCAAHEGCHYPEKCCMQCHRHKLIHTACILR
jgi:hypothetical protein